MLNEEITEMDLKIPLRDNKGNILAYTQVDEDAYL